MIISKKLLNNLYSNRKKFFAVSGSSLLLILMFQNCGGPGMTSASMGGGSTSGSSTSSSTSPGGGSSSGGGTTTGGGSTGSVYTVEQQRSNCFAALGNPKITSIVASGTSTVSNTATVSSGLGSSNSGDSKTYPTFDMNIDRGIINATAYNSTDNKCDTHINIMSTCEVVDVNPTNPTDSPISITSAINTSGASLFPSNYANMTAAEKTAEQIKIAKSSFVANNCRATFVAPGTKASFSIRPNTGNERCVQGNFWIKMTTSTTITGVTGSKTSDPQYFKVVSNNGCWNEVRLKDTAGDLPGVVNFGTAVAMDSGWAAVLAPTDDASSSILDVGSVYMYKLENNAWVQKQKIMMSDSAAYESLGSVALKGSTLVIGSPYRNGRGMAYFYRLSGTTWTQIQQIDPPNVNTNQAFGQSVAISDNYVYVGSPNYSATLVKGGAVAVYSYNSSGMSYSKSIIGAVANAAFGAALATDGNVLAVGAPQALGKESLAPGSVFVYTESSANYTLAATKTGSANAEKFGAAIALYGKHLAVGAPNFAVSGVAGFGRATYYDDYTLAATKTFNGGTAGDNQGQSVALSSTGLYIGAPFANTRAGQVDFYTYTGITDKTLYFRNKAYNETGNSAFGYAVAASGNDVLIGARIKSDPNDNSGAAYIYTYK